MLIKKNSPLFICDRCGKFTFSNSESNAPKRPNGWVRIRISGSQHKNMDLCDDCMESFPTWVKEMDWTKKRNLKWANISLKDD